MKELIKHDKKTTSVKTTTAAKTMIHKADKHSVSADPKDDSAVKSDSESSQEPHKRRYVRVKNELRLQLIISIKELGLTCLQAAKMLDIPYTNAKVIMHEFKFENKLLGRVRTHGGYHEDQPKPS
jgi:hypothetical protein